MNDFVHVAAAAIFGEDGRLLITRRPADVHQGGLWEFPGGKVEPGESVNQALSRELREELGIAVREALPLIRIPFHYPDKSVLLDVWRVTAFDGVPRGLEGQPLRWTELRALQHEEFPAANRPIINALKLPDRYMITGPFETALQCLERCEQALRRGVRMVQLRAKHLDTQATVELGEQLLPLCRRYGARLLVNDQYESALELGADGVHLSSRQLTALTADTVLGWRQRVPRFWVGASCHNPEQLQQAERLGADYVSLSPVQATSSHPDHSPLGWERFGQWVDRVSIPVFALGGMRVDSIGTAHAYGGQGIAAIGAFWDSLEARSLGE